MPGDAGWWLVREAVLPFGQLVVTTVVHARAYERGIGDAPVVVLGEIPAHRRQRPVAHERDRVGRRGRAGRVLPGRPEAAVHPAHPVPPAGPPSGPGFEEVTFFGRRRVGAARRWHERDSRWSAAATVVTVDGATRHVYPPPELEDLGWEFRGPNWWALEPSQPTRYGDDRTVCRTS